METTIPYEIYKLILTYLPNTFHPTIHIVPYIYKITNNIDDNIYIGSSMCNSLGYIWKNHLEQFMYLAYITPLYYLMFCYDYINFKIEIIDVFDYNITNELLLEKEVEYRNKLSTLNPLINMDYNFRRIKYKLRNMIKLYGGEDYIYMIYTKYIMEQKKEMLMKQKIKHKCECGLSYILKNKLNHYNTKVHIKRMKQL